MPTITDSYMKEMLAKSREYSFVILKPGPNLNMPNGNQIIWEHARRNFELRAEGKLAIVAPMLDGGEIQGIYIFAVTVEETKAIMDGDPAVKAGIFVYEIHPCRSFPGDKLP